MPGSAGRSYRLCSESFPFQTDCFAIYNLLATHHRTDTQRAPWGMISRALDHTRMANCTSSANRRRSDVKKKGKDQFTKEQEIHLPKHHIFVSNLFVLTPFKTLQGQKTHRLVLATFFCRSYFPKGNQFSPTPVAFCLV